VLDVSVDVDNNTPAPGEQVTYTVVVANTGSAPALNVEVEIVLPSAVELISVTPSQGTVANTVQPAKRAGLAAPLAQPGMGGAAGVNSQASQTIVVNIPELAGGESATITVVARVRNGASGTATTTATATAANVAGEVEDDAVIVIDAGAAAPTPTTPGASEQPRALPDTGATNGIQWSLLVTGLLLVVAGGVVFIRTRNAHTL
jgi:uncharacterized repeat protein (TIGR01451 family)/LPXTG-motif cell wall-anchored protein